MRPSEGEAKTKRRLLQELRRRWSDPAFQQRVREEAPFLDVADAIIGLRAELGLTQKELATLAGTTQSVIARLESGRQAVRTTLLNDIARGVGLTWRPHFESPALSDVLPDEAPDVVAGSGNVIHLDEMRRDLRHEPGAWSVSHRTMRPKSTPDQFSADEVRELLDRFVDTYLAPSEPKQHGTTESKSIAERRGDYSSAV